MSGSCVCLKVRISTPLTDCPRSNLHRGDLNVGPERESRRLPVRADWRNHQILQRSDEGAAAARVDRAVWDVLVKKSQRHFWGLAVKWLG